MSWKPINKPDPKRKRLPDVDLHADVNVHPPRRAKQNAEATGEGEGTAGGHPEAGRATTPGEKDKARVQQLENWYNSREFCDQHSIGKKQLLEFVYHLNSVQWHKKHNIPMTGLVSVIVDIGKQWFRLKDLNAGNAFSDQVQSTRDATLPLPTFKASISNGGTFKRQSISIIPWDQLLLFYVVSSGRQTFPTQLAALMIDELFAKNPITQGEQLTIPSKNDGWWKRQTNKFQLMGFSDKFQGKDTLYWYEKDPETGKLVALTEQRYGELLEEEKESEESVAGASSEQLTSLAKRYVPLARSGRAYVFKSTMDW
ncbi:hypothetical protein T439DRAFT_351770 [Meredithblackwellia eburnea MCA 4105]